MGSSTFDEAERLRILAREDAEARSRFDPGQIGGAPTLVVQTVTVKTYPTVAQRFYGVKAVTILGAEVESQAGSVTTGSGIFYALNIGSAVPPVGTQLIATFIGNRWILTFNG